MLQFPGLLEISLYILGWEKIVILTSVCLKSHHTGGSWDTFHQPALFMGSRFWWISNSICFFLILGLSRTFCFYWMPPSVSFAFILTGEQTLPHSSNLRNKRTQRRMSDFWATFGLLLEKCFQCSQTIKASVRNGVCRWENFRQERKKSL